MSSPYVRTVDKPTGKVTIAPSPSNIPTTGVPPLGLTNSGNWVPFSLNDDGTLPMDGISMVPHFDDVAAETDPGNLQELINNTVPEGVTRNLSSVILKTRVTGSFQVLANDLVIGSGRTGPGGSPTMNFNPARPISSGTEYKVFFTSRDDSPVTDVECYVQANDSNS